MIIVEVPDWCVIGSFIEWSNPMATGHLWVRERIIGYRPDGFLHQANNCPMYFTKFSEYGHTVRLPKDKI